MVAVLAIEMCVIVADVTTSRLIGAGASFLDTTSTFQRKDSKGHFIVQWDAMSKYKLTIVDS